MSMQHVNAISNRLSLRQPQRDSLEILHRVCELVGPDTDTDIAQALTEPAKSANERESPRKIIKTVSSGRSPTKARVGRPPQSSVAAEARQKVTVRLRPELIEGYRDWSWDARTSLSSLVEEALADYFARCGR